MRAQANFHGWDVETFADDAATQVYFEPPTDNLADALEPETGGYEQITDSFQQPAPVRSFEVDGTWRVPSIAPSRPHVEPAMAARSHVVRSTTRHLGRPAIGMFVAAACVLVGIGVGGFLAATGHSHSMVDAAPARVVMAAAPPVVTPIEIIPTAPAPVPAPAPAPVPAPVPVPVPVAAPAPVPVPAPAALPPPQPTFVAAPVHHHHDAPASAPVAPTAGLGKLAISSKPPCSIVIDGKDTGLVAPQRAIELAAGKHEVTLINAEEGIHLTAEVAITADRSTQLIRDFTN
jgi:hypothetical protein